MRFSIFTPSNDIKFLARLAESLAGQTYAGQWEWIILPNGDLLPQTVEALITLPQVRVLNLRLTSQHVGNLKHHCCGAAQGEILVEVDHDDELMPNCLQRLDETFAAEVDFVYSNCIEVGRKDLFHAAYGWQHRTTEWKGVLAHEPLSFPPSPAAFSRIWYAPNHVRAWRRGFYWSIGGHDVNYEVCDDHELLIRTYLRGRIVFLDEALYVYHVHDQNTSTTRNALVQNTTAWLYEAHVHSLVEHWAARQNLLKIDLCCADNPAPGYLGADTRRLGQRFVVNLDYEWPWADGSVGVFRAQDALEHLRDPVHTMREIERCLSPGGWLLSMTPSTDGRGAFQDPTHVSFWNENSFWYYTRAEQARFIGSPVRFQNVWCRTLFPSQWHQEHNIPYVLAHLMKLNGLTERPPGIIEI